MGEKKLTDEKAMFNYIANDIMLRVKPVYLRKEIVGKVFDLIHRLQSEKDEQNAEIERLKEENEIIKGNPPIIAGRSLGKTIREKLLAFDQMKEKNAELQKQVEALSLDLENWKKAAYGYKYAEEQAVKYTAKEIFEKIFFYRNRKDTTNFDNILLNMAKDYGVEVE